MVEPQVELDETKLKGEKFNPETCMTLLKKLNSDPDVDCKTFTILLLEFVKILNEMSTALSIAFKDITSKVATLRGNYAIFPEWQGGLIPFSLKEVELKIDILNGENNKKNTKDPKLAKYESSVRTMLRMTWFLDFLKVFFSGLGKDPTKSASDSAKEAYEKALGPHHSFLLRQAAKVAMVAAPGRKTFNTKLFPTLKPEEICAHLLAMEGELTKTTAHLWKFYTDNKLTELP
jgi:hypothetical protein